MAKGFGRMGGSVGGGMGSMRSQFQSLQKQMMEQQEKIAEMEVTSSVGGGVLKITMSGDQVCKNVEIDPEFLKDADAEMLQDMLITGINSALEQSKKLQEDQMSSITGGAYTGTGSKPGGCFFTSAGYRTAYCVPSDVLPAEEQRGNRASARGSIGKPAHANAFV